MPKYQFKPSIARLTTITAIILGLVVLGATFRGRPAENGTGLAYQNPGDWRTGVATAFESSNTNSRFALVDAIVNNHSFNLTVTQARFAAPDVVYEQGRFSTIFMPGVSMVAAPFYLLGQFFNLAQAFAFGSTILAAVANGILLYSLGRTLKMSARTALLGSAIFLLGTNSLAYAHTLTQHHLSTATILGGLLLISKKPSLMRSVIFGMLVGSTMLLDIPNLFMLLPVGITFLMQHFQSAQKADAQHFSIDLRLAGLVLGVLPLIGVFLWYNQQAFGSPLTYGQQFPRTDYFDSQEEKQIKQHQDQSLDTFRDKLPLSTRQQLRSSYILLVSNERSWLYYSPIVLIGIVGCIAAMRQGREDQKRMATVAIGIILMNVVVYSMFGDPWGGWSFGPRYLIPAASLLSLFAAFSLTTEWSSGLYRIVFFAVGVYSVAISTLGAVTTLSIPPKVEALQLSTYIPYTYEYNFTLLKQGVSSSLVYNAWAHRWLNAYGYWLLVTTLAALCLALLLSANDQNHTGRSAASTKNKS